MPPEHTNERSSQTGHMGPGLKGLVEGNRQEGSSLKKRVWEVVLRTKDVGAMTGGMDTVEV